MAVHDVDPLGSVFADQSGPLVGALPAADDEHPGTLEVLEADQFAGVGTQPLGQRRAPLGLVLEIPHTRRGDHRLGG